MMVVVRVSTVSNAFDCWEFLLVCVSVLGGIRDYCTTFIRVHCCGHYSLSIEAQTVFSGISVCLSFTLFTFVFLPCG